MRTQSPRPARWVSLVLVCLVVLTPAACVSISLSPASAPGSGQTDPGTGSDGSSGGGVSINIIGMVTLAAVGGYLVYQLITDEPVPVPQSQAPNSLGVAPDTASASGGRP